MSEDMRDEELEKEDEVLEAEQTGGKDRDSEIEETKETEASNDIPEIQEGTPDETEETEETERSIEQAPAGEEEEKKGFSKKRKDPRDEKVGELTDRVKRQMAEFENFCKRIDKGKPAMYETGVKNVIERILPVIGSSERGLVTALEDAKKTPLTEGMEEIYKQFQKTPEKAGVRAIKAIDQGLNLNYHNTVIHVDDDSLRENIVTEELQKGYTYRNSVVRHSMVKVAN